MEDIGIFEEELLEFEFDGFSIFHDKKRSIWFLETDEDDDDRITITIEDSEKSYFEEEKDALEKFNFSEEDLNTIKKFLN